MRTGDKISIGGDYQFNAYYQGRAIQRFWHYTKLTLAQERLAVSGTQRVLDAGCGSGLLASFLAQNTKADIWGIDANPAAIDFCKTQYPLPNLHFLQCLIDDLPFPNRSFDKIAFLEIIEHLTPRQGQKTLQKFYDLLEPGGLLVISTPNKKSAWPLIERLLDTFRLVPRLAGDQHEHLYSGKELKKIAAESGFTCTAAQTINLLSPWIAPVSWKLALRIHRREISSGSRIGALLLFTFRKPLTPDNVPAAH